jgi:CelD/BcsL family acetyltransferase involved in cellulose biosynthesis
LRRVVIAQNISEIASLRGLWERLCARSQGSTLFQAFALNELAASVRGGERPFVVAAETSSGAAIIPAAISDGTLTLLGDCLFDYRDILSDGDPEALSLAWQALAEPGLPLNIIGIRHDGHRETWEAMGWERWCAAPCVPRSAMSADEFCAAHSRLGSRLRKLERTGVELKHYTGGDSRLVRWIYEQKAQQPTGEFANVFADPRRVDFMLAWCCMADRQCEIFCFEAGSDIVSALVTFRDYSNPAAPARRFYTIYFDPRWEKFSPGTVLVYEVARRTLAEGLDADFMTGEQSHKLRMATSSLPLYRVTAQPAAMRAMAEEIDERARVAA